MHSKLEYLKGSYSQVCYFPIYIWYFNFSDYQNGSINPSQQFKFKYGTKTLCSLLAVIKLLGFSAWKVCRLQLLTAETNYIIVIVIGEPFQLDVVHFGVQQLVQHLDDFREEGSFLGIV